MATLTIGNTGTRPYLTLTVTQGNQNIASNSTDVSYSLVLHRKYKIVSGTVKKAFSVSINGTTYSGSIAVDGSGDLTVKSGSLTVKHADNGSKTISFSASMSLDITWDGTKINTISGSSSMKLTDIPRASAFGTVSGNAIGRAITINVTRHSSSFTHKIAYKIGTGSWSADTSAFATSVSITPPLSMCSGLPNSASGSMQIRLQTYSGSTKIGSLVYKSITVNVPSTVKPSISAVSITEAVSDIASMFEKFVKNKSKLKVAITASSQYSATIKSYSTSINGTNYSGQTFTSNVINASGNVVVKTTVIDSRGRSVSKETTINILDYFNPKIPTFKMQRCKKDGTLDDNGVYGKFTFSFEIASLGNKNSKSVQILAYKNSAWTNINNYGSTLDYVVTNKTLVTTTTFSADLTHQVKIVISDYFTKNVESTYIVDSVFTLLNYATSGKGLGIGKPCESNSFEIKLPTRFYDQTIPAASDLYWTLPQISHKSIVLPKGANLDDYTTPGIYTIYYDNLDPNNRPLTDDSVLNPDLNSNSAVSITLEVLPCRTNSIMLQRITYINGYGCKVCARYWRPATSGAENTWTSWVTISDTIKRILWTGTWYMSDSHTITLPEPISKQNKGIALIFSYYNQSTSTAEDIQFKDFFVPKEIVAAKSGKGHCFTMSSHCFGNLCTKYLYISDTWIKGHADNSATGTAANGITYNNRYYVLRYVIGV